MAMERTPAVRHVTVRVGPNGTNIENIPFVDVTSFVTADQSIGVVRSVVPSTAKVSPDTGQCRMMFGGTRSYVSSGAVDFKLDAYTPAVPPAPSNPPERRPTGKPASALEILLDGVEARLRLS